MVLVWDSERAAPSLKSLARVAGDARDPLPVLVIDATTHYPGSDSFNFRLQMILYSVYLRKLNILELKVILRFF